MEIWKKLAVLVTLGLLLAACRTEAVYEVRNRPLPTVAQNTLNNTQLERIFIEAALARNWRVEVVQPGLIKASMNIRNKHTAVSDIHFNRNGYSILLSSSQNLKQDSSGQIHRTYNKIVQVLEREIENRLYRASY